MREPVLLTTTTTTTCTHSAVLVVEVDDQAEGPPPHGLGGDEGVLEGGLSPRRNHSSQLESGEVLDVELVVLKGRGQSSKGSSSSSSRSFFT